MTTTLILMRHGQSTWNVARRCQGAVLHPRLTLEGLKQAKRAALVLSDQHIDLIVSSDQLRAYQTAGVVAVEMGLPVYLDSRLREMAQGVWQGMLYPQIKAEYGEMYDAFTTDATQVTPPDGESIFDLRDRVITALDEVVGKYEGKTILVVTHEIPMAVVAALAKGKTLADIWENPPGNAETVTIRWPLPARVKKDEAAAD